MPKIKIYSTATCVYCVLEKDYLESKGIEFEEILIDKVPEAAQASFDTCGSMGVPCTHIIKDDGTDVRILGFDKPRLDAVLGLS